MPLQDIIVKTDCHIDMEQYIEHGLTSINNNPVDFFIHQIELRAKEEQIKNKYNMNNGEFVHELANTYRLMYGERK